MGDLAGGGGGAAMVRYDGDVDGMNACDDDDDDDGAMGTTMR